VNTVVEDNFTCSVQMNCDNVHTSYHRNIIFVDNLHILITD